MIATSHDPASAGHSFPNGTGWWKYASPQAAYFAVGRLLPWLLASGVVVLSLGLGVGFLVAPTDHQQGEVYRILFVHVPTAWVAMVVYVAMAFWAGVGLVMNTRLSFMLMQALAPTGTLSAFLCLWTGALWGKPTWGTWWVWDARLTSVLILLFLYVGFIALQSAIEDSQRADHAGAVLALVGVVNVPIIYFSVKWWNTLHQGASISLGSAPTLAPDMLLGLLASALGLWLLAIAAVLARLRCIVLERERHTGWAARAVEGAA